MSKNEGLGSPWHEETKFGWDEVGGMSGPKCQALGSVLHRVRTVRWYTTNLLYIPYLFHSWIETAETSSTYQNRSKITNRILKKRNIFEKKDWGKAPWIPQLEWKCHDQIRYLSFFVIVLPVRYFTGWCRHYYRVFRDVCPPCTPY